MDYFNILVSENIKQYCNGCMLMDASAVVSHQQLISIQKAPGVT